MAFCSSCGAKIEEGAKFCPGCGFQIGSAGVSINQEKAVNIIQAQPTVLPANIPQYQNTTIVQTAGADEKYCFSCGSVIKKAAESCTRCGVNQSMRNNTVAIDVYCASCGKNIKKEATICPFCGVQQTVVFPTSNMPQYQNTSMVQTVGADEKYCFSCGSVIKKAAEMCPKCGVNQSTRNSTSAIDVYCTSCGKNIKKEAPTCPFCGVQQGTGILSAAKGGKSATASLVLGILGVVPGYGLVTSILAIIFGIIGLKTVKKNRARVGLILGIIFLVLSIILIATGVFATIMDL
jgi:RNA polymerase subunit RPABC4/transcription elongation factor Spt4